MKKNRKIKFNILILGLIVLNLFILDLLLLDNLGVLKFKSLISEKIESSQRDQIFEEINPSKGYALNANYSDLGPKMVSMEIIDLDKFKNADQLSDEELNILTKGSNVKIKITRENSHFLLNFFWALGLANNTKILTDGEMQKYGNPANFASTGGWTLSRENSMNYYSKASLISLTPDQEKLVQEVASNIYRPCCDNSTAFPDCNHGMALLGVLEFMAANGASEQQMYDAAKYTNAYWFPTNYYDIARYLKMNGGKSFTAVDSKTVLGKNYSSATGYSQIKKWLTEGETKNAVPQQGSGSSCGV